jgi:hypothetical protein
VLELPHVAVGAAIATKVVHPALAIPLSFGSHFLLEKIPHWNPHLNTEKKKYGKITPQSTKIVIVDSTLSLALGVYVASQALPNTAHAITILLSCFAAVLPDVIEAPYFFLNWKSKIIEKWIAFQKSIQSDTTVIPGLATQFATLIAALWMIFG